MLTGLPPVALLANTETCFFPVHWRARGALKESAAPVAKGVFLAARSCRAPAKRILTPHFTRDAKAQSVLSRQGVQVFLSDRAFGKASFYHVVLHILITNLHSVYRMQSASAFSAEVMSQGPLVAEIFASLT